MNEISMRVREKLSEAGVSQKSLAERVGMTPDALSRAINGQRGFAAIELAGIAAALETDVHYLITGEQDPYRMVLSARHTYNASTHQRSVGGIEDDTRVLEGVRLAYVQALG